MSILSSSLLVVGTDRVGVEERLFVGKISRTKERKPAVFRKGDHRRKEGIARRGRRTSGSLENRAAQGPDKSIADAAAVLMATLTASGQFIPTTTKEPSGTYITRWFPKARLRGIYINGL